MSDAIGGSSDPAKKVRDAEIEAQKDWYERKSALMASRLGSQHPFSAHALIPFNLGGRLDLFYYPNGIPGTGIATKELSEIPTKSPCNLVFSCYELVMFTRVSFSPEDALKPTTPFGRIHATINAVLNPVARSCSTILLEARNTAEFPADMPGVEGTCLLFDGYGCWPDEVAGEFGLMLIMAIHRRELEFTQKQGSERLLERLKGAGVYPYSDLDRPSVV